jgi:hypothetical protein
MLYKVVDGGAAPDSAAEVNGSGWQTLSFDFNALKIQLLRIDRMQEYFSFLYGSLVVVLTRSSNDYLC